MILHVFFFDCSNRACFSLCSEKRVFCFVKKTKSTGLGQPVAGPGPVALLFSLSSTQLPRPAALSSFVPVVTFFVLIK